VLLHGWKMVVRAVVRNNIKVGGGGGGLVMLQEGKVGYSLD
jgi:hypothetical protein